MKKFFRLFLAFIVSYLTFFSLELLFEVIVYVKVGVFELKKYSFVKPITFAIPLLLLAILMGKLFPNK